MVVVCASGVCVVCCVCVCEVVVCVHLVCGVCEVIVVVCMFEYLVCMCGLVYGLECVHV